MQCYTTVTSETCATYRLYPLWVLWFRVCACARACVLLLSDHKTSPVNAADLLSHQEKLAKSIHYLISKEDQVRTQITELEVLISQTEVRELTHAAAMPTSLIHSILMFYSVQCRLFLSFSKSLLSYPFLLLFFFLVSHYFLLI